MKTLVLCRHAKSDYPEHTADIDRPLSERGHRDAISLGQRLQGLEWTPDLIISSPAVRAHETAKLVAQELAFPVAKIGMRLSIYNDGAGALTELVKGLPNTAKQVMLFGHNPTMEQAVRFYLQMDARFDMPTGGMVGLESDHDTWASFFPPMVRLRWYHIPRIQRKNS